MDESSSLPAGTRVVVSQLGDDPIQALDAHTSLEPMEAPDPGTLRPTDVIVKVRAAAVGWVDLLMMSGQYQHMAKPPYTPGLEYAGEIAWVGPEVDNVRVGDAVMIDAFVAGPRSLGDYQAWGGFASYAVAPAAAAYPLPDGWDFDQGCNLFGSYETAYHCLIARGALQAGETVLIHGASGATGLAAVHVAKLVGATVIATGRTASKLEVVQAEGADHIVNTGGEGARFRDRVKELTGGRGVDVVYDGVGGATSLESLRCVRFGARFLIVGWASTPFVARGRGQRGAPNANVLPTNLIMMKGLDVLGCPTVISTVNDPSIRTARLEAILGWVRDGRVRPHVSHRFPLADYRAAMKAKWGGQIVGGGVVHP